MLLSKNFEIVQCHPVLLISQYWKIQSSRRSGHSVWCEWTIVYSQNGLFTRNYKLAQAWCKQFRQYFPPLLAKSKAHILIIPAVGGHPQAKTTRTAERGPERESFIMLLNEVSDKLKSRARAELTKPCTQRNLMSPPAHITQLFKCNSCFLPHT